MTIVPLNQENSRIADELCAHSPDAWFWHTKSWRAYQKEYRPNLESQEKSFLLFDQNGDALAFCPIFLENHGDRREFSFGSSHLPPPALANGLTPKRREEVYRTVFEAIDALASEHRASRCSFRISPLTPSPFNFLMKYGYLDASLNSQVIDTGGSLEGLRKGLRKGHASDVKRAKELFETCVFDKDSLTDPVFAQYQELHRKASGRVTRPQATFDAMKAMIRAGDAILVAARQAEAFIGFSLVTTYRGRAYYASAANDPDAGNLPINHGIQWKTLEWLNERGYSSYEIGWQEFGPQLHSFPSEKEIALGHFKRGFGGRTVPIFVGEKYYDPAFCAKTLTARAQKFLEGRFKIKP